MKTINKKAILGMLVAIVMSLGVLQGINLNKQSEDVRLQQLWAAVTVYRPLETQVTSNRGQFALSAFGTSIAFVIGLANPVAGLAYGL
jgi:hypothetical protein